MAAWRRLHRHLPPVRLDPPVPIEDTVLATAGPSHWRARPREAPGALAMPLSPKNLRAIQAALPRGAAAAERYAAARIARLDSERPVSRA
jgi:hypothetical protein